MERIAPPPDVGNLLVRNGEMEKVNVVSELGIYGIWLRFVFLLKCFLLLSLGGSDDVVVYENEVAGYLLRSKADSTNEGGVAAGYAVIDSPLLIP